MSVTVLPVVPGLTILLIALLSLFLYLKFKCTLDVPDEDVRNFYIVVLFMVIVPFLVTLFAGIEYSSLKKLGKYLYLLLIIPLYFYFLSVRLNQKALWYGLILASLISGVMAVYEIVFEIYKPGYSGRAKGATHPIIFGNMALLSGVLSVAGLGWFKERARWQILLPILAFLMGLVASILSQSRGGWIAIPFCLIIFFWASHCQISVRKFLLGVILLFGVMTVSYLIPQTGLEQKIQNTVHNIENYINSDPQDELRATSIGARLGMWWASWQMFIENPISGVGWGHFQEHTQALLKRGELNWYAASFNHPHSQFFSALANGGVLAFAVLVLFFWMPARIFIKYLKSEASSVHVKRFALAGLLLVVMFAVFNLTESFLERSRTDYT